jgi:hypothetical protein
MIDWILTQWANPWIAIGLYWLPLAFCGFGYVARTARNYVKDRADREKAEAAKKAGETGSKSWYIPTDTIGDLIGRAFVTIIPVGNLFAACFDVAPEVFGKFFEWIGRTFNQPLVPKRER